MHLGNRCYPAVALAAMLMLSMDAQSLQAQGRPAQGQMEKMEKMDKMQMEKMMSGWPAASKEAAMFMTTKYGSPAAMSKDMMVWGKTGPWKRTIIYAHEYPHEFPVHHTDVMQQFIDYKAPTDMYDDLALYDGSVVLERTSGEMSARCDKEGANFLALNLANDIVTGKRSVQDARKMYGEQVMAMKAKQRAPYTEKLLFQPASGTGDPDRPVMMEASRPRQ
ncbi:MAG: hypothetical protein M3Q37_09465 [Gemmatimonadota bacterium]|nr:hypothetical protein [Gemmatimonadota bacterium]